MNHSLDGHVVLRRPAIAAALAVVLVSGAACARKPPVEITRAIGTEPFWGMQVRSDHVVFTRPDADSLVYPYTPPVVSDSGVLVYASKRFADDTTLTLTIEPGTCSDGMSDRTYPAKATVERGARTWKGCATVLPGKAGASAAASGTKAPVPVTPESAAAPPATEAPAIALDGEGLRLVAKPSGSTRLLAFGAPQSDVVNAVNATEPSATPKQAESADCGATVVTWPSGLSAYFTFGKFAGWAVRENSPKLTTMSGVGVGSKRSALESAYSTTITTSTLGTEFTAGGIAGLLASLATDARVTNMWAGSACIAR